MGKMNDNMAWMHRLPAQYLIEAQQQHLRVQEKRMVENQIAETTSDQTDYHDEEQDIDNELGIGEMEVDTTTTSNNVKSHDSGIDYANLSIDEAEEHESTLAKAAKRLEPIGLEEEVVFHGFVEHDDDPYEWDELIDGNNKYAKGRKNNPNYNGTKPWNTTKDQHTKRVNNGRAKSEKDDDESVNSQKRKRERDETNGDGRSKSITEVK
jgi:hypothetical protein